MSSTQKIIKYFGIGIAFLLIFNKRFDFIGVGIEI